MLADPQSVTVTGVAITLPRTGIGSNYADYSNTDGTTSLRVLQSTSRTSKRTSITLRTTKIAADPLTAVNQRLASSVTVVVQAPDGFTVTELKDQLVALATLLTASSAATAVKILGGEK